MKLTILGVLYPPALFLHGRSVYIQKAEPICALRQERPVSPDISYYFTIKNASGGNANTSTANTNATKNHAAYFDTIVRETRLNQKITHL